MSTMQAVLGRCVVAMVGGAPGVARAAFSCPAAEPSGRGEPDFGAVDLSAGGAGVGKAVLASIDHMRTEGVKSGTIVDRLVSGYCGALNRRAALSDDAKADQVRRLAARVSTFVYDRRSAPQEEDVIVDVPLASPLFGRMQAAIGQAKVSQDAWITGAIEQKLGTP